MTQLSEIVEIPVTLSLLVVVLGDASQHGRPSPLPKSTFDLYSMAIETRFVRLRFN